MGDSCINSNVSYGKYARRSILRGIRRGVASVVRRILCAHLVRLLYSVWK